MKSIIFGMAFAFAALFSMNADAANYTYVEAGYIASDIEDRSGDQYTVNASVAVGEHFFVTGGYTNGIDSDFDVGIAHIGLGFHTPLADRLDGYVKVEATALTETWSAYDRWAYRGEAGVRYAVTDRFELRGGVAAEDLRYRDALVWTGTVGAEIKLTNYLALGVDVRGKDDYLAGQASLRLYF